MNQTKLDTGFLILNDWIPILRELSAVDLKKLLFALIDYQREGVPMPEFSRNSTQMVAKMLGGAVKRRVASAVGGRRSAEVRLGKTGDTKNGLPMAEKGEVTSEVASGGTSEPRREEKRREENRIEEREREKGARSAPALPEGKMSPPPESELSPEEMDFLERQGVPPLYVKARLARAAAAARAQGISTASLILSWWYQDLVEGKGGEYLGKREESVTAASTFDVDDFFAAAVARTYGEG